MDLSPDIRARFRECSEEFEQTALAKSSLLHRQVPGTSDGPTSPSRRGRESLYTTDFEYHQSLYNILHDLKRVPFALWKFRHCRRCYCQYTSFGSALSLQNSASSIFMSILLSAPQIVSQALTFDFRPSDCELEDCHSDGHKRQPELELSGRSVTVCTNSPIVLLLLLSFEVAFIYNNMIIMLRDTRSVPYLLKQGDRTTILEAPSMSLDR